MIFECQLNDVLSTKHDGVLALGKTYHEIQYHNQLMTESIEIKIVLTSDTTIKDEVGVRGVDGVDGQGVGPGDSPN